MNIKHKNLQEETIEVVPENPDDFLTLRNIIEEGDKIESITFRSQEQSSDKIRPEKRKKEPVRLTIEVEEIKYQDFSGRLRITGIVVEGKEDFKGRYHTINIEKNKSITIKKHKWKEDQINRLKKAQKESKKPTVAILAISEGEATLGIINRHGISKTNKIETGSGKREEDIDRRKEFFSKTYKFLKRALKTNKIDKLVLAGPGFTKKDFQDFLKNRDQEIIQKIHVEDTASSGERGIKEAIKRGAIKKIWKESRITDESRIIEDLLEKIAKNEEATYGEKQVKKANELGAIKKLLISEETLRKKRKNNEKEIEELIEETRQKGGSVKILSSEFEPGQKLESLSGIAAILRYKINH